MPFALESQPAFYPTLHTLQDKTRGPCPFPTTNCLEILFFIAWLGVMLAFPQACFLAILMLALNVR
jgi:hypothetical protein